MLVEKKSMAEISEESKIGGKIRGFVFLLFGSWL